MLARHCTAQLTLDRYSHVYSVDFMQALGTLPDLSGASSEQARATGTDNQTADEIHLASHLAFEGGFDPNSVDSIGQNGVNIQASKEKENPRLSQQNQGFSNVNGGEGGQFPNCTSANAVGFFSPSQQDSQARLTVACQHGERGI